VDYTSDAPIRSEDEEARLTRQAKRKRRKAVVLELGHFLYTEREDPQKRKG